MFDRRCQPENVGRTRDVHPMLVQCWPIVYDAGSTLYQLRVNVSCLLVTLRVRCKVLVWRGGMFIQDRGPVWCTCVVDSTNPQCWFSTVSTSSALASRWLSVGPVFMFLLDCVVLLRPATCTRLSLWVSGPDDCAAPCPRHPSNPASQTASQPVSHAAQPAIQPDNKPPSQTARQSDR